MRHKHISTIALITLLTTANLTTAQNTITPTPAPSKTPTRTPTTITLEQTPSPTKNNTLVKPFTQQELSVLTGNVQRPNGIIWFNNKLYTACNGDWTLYKIDATTGSTETYIYGVKNAHSLYIEEDSTKQINLWVPDFESNTLLFITQNRSPQIIASNLKGPWGIATLTSNQFLISNLLNDSVSIVNRTGESKEIITGLRKPTGIAIDEEYVYIANNGSARRAIEWIKKTDITDTEVEITTQPLITGLQNATGLALGSDGYLYFAYALGTRGVIGRIDPQKCQKNGGCSNDEVEIVIYTELPAPLAGLTLSPDMRLYVHTIFRPEIYWVQL